MRIFIHYLTLILFVFFLPLRQATLYAQYDEKDFIHYTIKDGLTDNYITCLRQDDYGYLWIGAELGLNRFDGHSFDQFYQELPEDFLVSSRLRQIKSFGTHKLGFISDGGFQLLNTNDYSIKNYLVPDTTAFVTMRNAAWDAVELPDGSFAVTTASGFYVFDRSGTLSFRKDAYSLSDIGIKRILYGRNIFSISDNKYLVYNEENQLSCFDAQHNVYTDVSPDDAEWNSFIHPAATHGGNWINKIQLSADEFIFLPHTDSIIYYNHALKKKTISPLPFRGIDEFTWESKIEKVDDNTYVLNGGYAGFFRFYLDHHTGVIRFEEKKFLPNFKINCLFIDKDQRLWVGSATGLLQQRMNPGFIKKYDLTIDDHSPDGFEDAYFYKEKLYLCRYSGDVGLVIVDPMTMKVLNQIEFYGRDNAWNEIYTIEMYHPDTLWLGTNLGILWLDTKTNHYGKLADVGGYSKEFCQANSLKKPDANGYAWMCYLMQGMVMRYHIPSRTYTIFTTQSKPPLPFNKVKSIAYDAYGDVWIGGHSLARWNHLTQDFDTLISVYAGTNKFKDDILALIADDEGSLWMHNVDNGILEYRIKEKKFYNYSMRDGLPSNSFLTLSPVINQKLWMGSHQHLTGLDIQNKKLEVYNYQDGLPLDNSPINTNMFFDSSSHQMFMFYKNEVVAFPVDYHYPVDKSSELTIEKLMADHKLSYYYPGREIQLKSNENNISIKYSVIDFEGGNNYLFAYKLNHSATWTNVGTERSLHLSELPPGNYSIQIQATAKSGQQKEKELHFSIAPPFWKSPWFYCLCILLTGGLAYLIYRSRIAQIRQRANIDKLISQTEMKALHAQMNPHFIFNSLNSIREMILNNNNKDASRYLSKFAHLIRVTLDQSGQSFISLRNTIDYLKRYIEMEKIRNSHFNVDITADLDLELDETILPPMLIQPFIENAIWHGTNGDHRQIDIHVEFKKEGDRLVCIVDDNGIGIDRSLSDKNEDNRTHQAVGISNIKSRIQLLNRKHNLQSSISVEDKSLLNGQIGTGTRVTLYLPLEISEQ